jgi:hypothetical protein
MKEDPLLLGGVPSVSREEDPLPAKGVEKMKEDPLLLGG